MRRGFERGALLWKSGPMHTLYLIDDNGFREARRRGVEADFWKKFNAGRLDAPWPAFTQLAIDAPAERVVEALRALSAEFELPLEEVGADPAHQVEGIYVATHNGLTLVSEPHTDLDERLLGEPMAEWLVRTLYAPAAYFGYDPSCATLHLTMFHNGRPVFAWCDSVMPGPSYAYVFNGDGTCTHEDPRHFALRMLDMPLTSPLLDRYAFVESNLRSIGIDQVCPDLTELPLSAVLACREL